MDRRLGEALAIATTATVSATMVGVILWAAMQVVR